MAYPGEEERHGITRALIYARVSSVKQKTQGHGLESQITRCAEYALRRGYEVIEIFQEDISGKLIERPGMNEMLSFLEKHKDPLVVIIDDISRLARDVVTHIQLRGEIARAGGVLESPNMQFGNDSDSQFMENIMAAFSQHDRVKNAERTKNRMRARTQNGYWCFTAPKGYEYQNVEGHGKMLVPVEPLAAIVKEGLEGYASGRFETQGELKYFLERHVAFPRGKHGGVHFTRIKKMLECALYAGYINVPKWDMADIKGKHEPLISYQTYQRIQDRLNGKAAIAPTRRNSSADFPLRGFVTCHSCGNTLTACWSRGKTKEYPYYLCPTRTCEMRGKSIRKDRIEGEFEDILGALTPSQALFRAARSVLEHLWDERLRAHQRRAQGLIAQRNKLEKNKEQFLTRIVEADSASIINAYENKIRELEKQRIILGEQIRKSGEPQRPFKELYRTSMEFLGNPLKIWRSESFADKRLVLKLTFADKLTYVRNEGYRTPKTTLPFKVLGDVLSGESVLVGPERFELPT